MNTKNEPCLICEKYMDGVSCDERECPVAIMKAENERLEDDNQYLQDRRWKELSEVRAEAIKEFAERLCDGKVSNDPVVIAAKCAVKEMTEGQHET